MPCNNYTYKAIVPGWVDGVAGVMPETEPDIGDDESGQDRAHGPTDVNIAGVGRCAETDEEEGGTNDLEVVRRCRPTQHLVQWSTTWSTPPPRFVTPAAG